MRCLSCRPRESGDPYSRAGGYGFPLARERHRDDRCKTAAQRTAPRTGGKIGWCRRADSNRQPIAYEAIALPLSYCGVQKGPSTKLLSKKPAPVEEAQSALSVVPAQAGTHIPEPEVMGPRLRGDDSNDVMRGRQRQCDHYGRNSARMRLQPSAEGVAGSGAGSASVSPLGPGSSGACTSGITAGATAVISPARGARDSSAAAAIARRALLPPAEKGSA